LTAVARRLRLWRYPWAIVVLLLAVAPALGAADGEHWYFIELAGQRAGWMVERQATRDGLTTTESESELRIHRGGTELVLNFSSQFVETTAGKPVSMRSVQRFGQQPMILEATFDDEGVIEKTVQGEATHQRRLPAAEEGWLTPAVAQRALVKAPWSRRWPPALATCAIAPSTLFPV